MSRTRKWSAISTAKPADLIDYCGLPWDDQCLSFHETDRPVATASNVQVRRPLYRSSVERWRRYEAYLGRCWPSSPAAAAAMKRCRGTSKQGPQPRSLTRRSRALRFLASWIQSYN